MRTWLNERTPPPHRGPGRPTAHEAILRDTRWDGRPQGAQWLTRTWLNCTVV